jgi:hypothetical protein
MDLEMHKGMGVIGSFGIVLVYQWYRFQSKAVAINTAFYLFAWIETGDWHVSEYQNRTYFTRRLTWWFPCLLARLFTRLFTRLLTCLFTWRFIWRFTCLFTCLLAYFQKHVIYTVHVWPGSPTASSDNAFFLSRTQAVTNAQCHLMLRKSEDVMAWCNYCVIENQNPEHASASPFNKHQNPSLPDTSLLTGS